MRYVISGFFLGVATVLLGIAVIVPDPRYLAACLVATGFSLATVYC